MDIVNKSDSESLLPSGRVAGFAILLSSVLSLVLMTHHPTTSSREINEFLAEIIRETSINSFVHGALIALLSVQVFGFSCFASRPRPEPTLMRAGLVSYLIGASVMIIAALISGFLVPALAERYQGGTAEELDAVRHLMRLSGIGNHVCSKAGVIAMSLAVLLWSVALLKLPGSLRGIASLGLIVGVVPILAVLTGHLRMTVHGMGIFLLAQTLWAVAISVQLIRRRI